ncbi:terminase small subunit [Methylocella sp. CPCC 101449]|uniref:terminase small subunit n=1 Tax=Methylocella sp. CPCC 101449 TaxID=2987531 RepID=UPI002891DB94|nr:terminase small subunit [Methylocella sp. CPCC 101449]MDT2024554.1 terminase small subunit [Methylocella sp. CPCC 101449]
MPVLDNPRHELFAQAIAKGASQREAYKSAGYEAGADTVVDAAASRLLSDVKVKLRIAELLEVAAQAAGATAERIAAELSKIAFSDIRKAVQWGKSPVDQTSDNADPNGLRIYPVELVPSETIDENTAAAVSEVSLTQTGIKIKMHDKMAALNSLAKYRGMFIEKHELTGKDGGPIEAVGWSNMSLPEKRDFARRFAFLLSDGLRASEALAGSDEAKEQR